MFEIVETAGKWVVRQEGREVARFHAEEHAMLAVSERMRDHAGDEPVAFSIRFNGRSG